MTAMRICPAFVVLLASASACGCSESGPALGKVSGVVTLDGEPLPKANVAFEPTSGAAPSYGKTDDQGRYELRYTPQRMGALVGEHRVRISTWRSEPGENGVTVEVPEQVPAKYNDESELRETVEEGSQTINFELQAGA